MKNTLVFAVLFSFLILGSCASDSNSAKQEASATETESTTKAESSVAVGLSIGNRAPDMEYPSPEGEMIKLSSLRGKMVLIDFWAGWCPPCRRENPNIVATYDEFKDSEFKNGSGFTVYSVSLDATREMWVNAIAEDDLKWKYHVSDLKYWESVPAAMYQVRGIPASWLIDGDGVILATNLRGEALPNKLREYLK